MSCSEKHWVPLNLQRGPQGASSIASGNSGHRSSCEGHLRISLESLQRNRESSQVEAGNSGLLSSCGRDLGVPIELHQKSQASSRDKAWNFTFLSSCKRDVRPPVKFRRGTWAFPRGVTGGSDLPSLGVLGVPFEAVQGNQSLSPVEMELGVLLTCSRNGWVPLEFQ